MGTTPTYSNGAFTASITNDGRVDAIIESHGASAECGAAFRLNAIIAGGEVLADCGAPSVSVRGDETILERGRVVERFRPIPGGVEQLFDVRAPLAAAGDLTIQVAVTTAMRGPEEGTTSDMLTFWDGQLAALTYGHVVTVDAAGSSVASPVTYGGGLVSFSIPESWLQTAAYPITVDPVIGAVIVLTSSPQNGPYHNNDVAYNATADQYLTVYAESNVDNDVFARTINPVSGATGAVLTIVSGAGHTFAPAISWNPSNNQYLVAWADAVNGDLVLDTWRVRCLVLDATGAPLGGVNTPFDIAVGAGSLDPFGPDIACDGTNWLITWFDQANDGVAAPNTGVTDQNVFARLVPGTTTNASQSLGAVLNVANSANFERTPAVAFGAGGNYLITWLDASANAGLGGIFGRTVSTAGVLGTATQYDDTTDVINVREEPSVCANTTANEFLIGWDQWDSTTFLGDPVVRRISSAGALIGGANVTNLDTNISTDAFHVTTVYNAAMDQYLVFWYDDAGSAPQFYDVEASQLTAATLAVVQGNFSLGTIQSAPTGYGSPSASAASRTATTHVICLWRQLPWDGVGSLTPPFDLEAQRFDLNNPPSAPVVANMIQKQGAAATAPTDAEGITYTTLPRQESFSGGASTDPEGQQIRLQIERILDASPFTGTFTEQSALVASGGSPTITVSAIPNGAYKWRARFVDALGTASAWVDFATATTPDHTFNVPNQLPGLPDVTQNATTGQFQMNGTTQIPTGGLTPQGTVILKGSIGADADGDNVRLEVEVQPIGTAFTNTPTLTSTFGAAGVHQVSFTPVTSTAGYHWQARVRDSSGAANDTTAWVSYGLNPEANIDFARDAAANTTAAPGALLQFEADGTTPLATGATAGSRTVVMKATTTDPEGDQYTLEVEVKPISVAFDGTVTASSAATNSGAQATVSVTIAGFNPESYHWQVRTRDALNATSAFVVFVGAAGDVPPAGVDFALPAVSFGGSRNNLKCSLAAGAFGLPWLLALLALAGLARRRR